jgi:FkbM family methyltransferase
MLLATDAVLFAFEPGPDNNFYASSSLYRLLAEVPSFRHRVRLFPLALGAENRTDVLNAAVGNAGHSVIGARPQLYAPKGHTPPEQVLLRTLDDILWPRAQRSLLPPSIGLLKLDVEGFECRVLQGMRQLLAARTIRMIKTEVFEYGLRAQGCSAVELQRTLTQAGFALYRVPPRAGDVPLGPDAVYSSAPYNLYCILEPPQRGMQEHFAGRAPQIPPSVPNGALHAHAHHFRRPRF